MKYVSIDIETSGLDSEKNKVLSVAAIIEDTNLKLDCSQLPKFHAIIIQNEIIGSPRAISINKDLINDIADYVEGDDTVRELIKRKSGCLFLEEHNLSKEFFRFLFGNGYNYDILTGAPTIDIIDGKYYPQINSKTKPITINVAGKNFATFDKLFLEKLEWWKKLIRTRQRIIDPAILFCDWKNDDTLPSLTTCKERANIDGIVSHNALEDAWDVIEVLRKHY